MTYSAIAQASALLLLVWTVFRLAPSIPANAKAWIWRLALLKPLVGLLPLAAVTLYLLPAKPIDPPAASVTTESYVADERPYQPYQTSTPIPAPARIDPVLALWLLGVGAVAAYGLVGSARAAMLVRRATPVQDPEVLSTLSELMERAGVRRTPQLLASSAVQSAVLVGGWRAAIVLPRTMLEAGSAEDTRLMLAHEVAHLARKDLHWFGAMWVVQALFFFNPIVWVAARCSRLDHESATDRSAAELAGVPVPTYAGMLLRATVVPRTSLVPGILPMAESYRTIHRRLEAMKHFNSQPSLWRKTAIGAITLATAGLLPMYELAEAHPMPQQGTASAGSTVPATAVSGSRATAAKPLSTTKAKKQVTTKNATRASSKGASTISVASTRPARGGAVNTTGSITRAATGTGLNTVSSAGATMRAGSGQNTIATGGRASVSTTGGTTVNTTAVGSGQGVSTTVNGTARGGSISPNSRQGATIVASGQGPSSSNGGSINTVQAGGSGSAGGTAINTTASGSGQGVSTAAGGTARAGGISINSQGATVVATGQGPSTSNGGGVAINTAAASPGQGVSTATGGQATVAAAGGGVNTTAQGVATGGGARLFSQGGTAGQATTRGRGINTRGAAVATQGRIGGVGQNRQVGEAVTGRLSTRAQGENGASVGRAFSRTGTGSTLGWIRSAGSSVSFEYRNFSTQEALRDLVRVSQKKAVIDPTLTGRINMTATNLGFEDALRNMARAAGGTYRLQNGTYYISRK